MIHNFDLELGRILGVEIYWYGAVYSVGFLGVLIYFATRRRHLGWSSADVFELSILMAVGILIFGRAFDILVYELDYYWDEPLAALNWWRGGMASHGVLIGGVVGVVLFCLWREKPFIETADELTVPAALLLALGRLGNFIEGGVVGFLTTMPWGVIYPDLEGPRHPVALYESAKNFLIIPILMLLLRQFPSSRGIATGAFVFLYAALRFLVDTFRDYEGGWFGMGQGQYFNLVMAVFGLAILIWAWRRSVPATPRAPPAVLVRPANWLHIVIFAFLCLYPLGIPTSWTRINIEEKRGQELVRPEPGGDDRRSEVVIGK